MAAADGSDALANAAFHGNAPVVNALLDAGARIVDAAGDRSALYSAVAGRQPAMIRLLLDRHPGQDAIDSAFVVAARRRLTAPVSDEDTMRMLAAAGANVRKVAPVAFANLWANASDDDAADRARVLLDLGAVLADLDGANGEVGTRTPLMDAAAYRFPRTVDVLLAHGARLDVRLRRPNDDDDGETALIFAVRTGSPEIVTALLDKGADAGVRDARGLRAIDHAKRGDSPDPTGMLQALQRGAPTSR